MKTIKILGISIMIIFCINNLFVLTNSIQVQPINFKSSEYSKLSKEVINEIEGYSLASQNEVLYSITSTITKDQKEPYRNVIQADKSAHEESLLDNLKLENLTDEFNRIVNIQY